MKNIFGNHTVKADSMASACQMMEDNKLHISRIFNTKVSGIESFEAKRDILKCIFQETVFGTFSASTKCIKIKKDNGKRKSQKVKTGDYQYYNQLTKKFGIDICELV